MEFIKFRLINKKYLLIILSIIIFPNINCNSQNQNPMKIKDGKRSNRLINEKSPYLLQHAFNPVNWYPWSNEAFELADKEDKPIFLSIGYSTCHWCHVMERESFEDSTVADLLNKYFVSIKVDREERPDIDNIYMTVAQMLTGSGGWPLTIIMTPDKKPFFAGTYFPKENRFGRPGLIDILTQIKDAWVNQHDKIISSSNQIIDALKKSTQSNTLGNEITLDVLNKSVNNFTSSFDKVHGGFGNAPKFPSPHNLLFLLRQYNRNNDPKVLQMVTTTLDKMSEGGIFDQIGFGFHRYSTDEKWLVPHFEKMIYDQAMLAMAYTETYQLTRDEKYKNVSDKIFEYVLRDMTSSEGGFYTAEDADSDGEEGKFYFWTYSELKKILSPDDFKIFIKTFNLEEGGNFVDQIKGGKDGNNILHRTNTNSELAKEFKITEKDLSAKIEKMRKNLFGIREKRIHPLKDDKILTDWNGLMIAALAQAGKVFEEQKYISAAERSVKFILSKLSKQNGELLHRYRKEEVKIDGHLDDYSFMIWGLLNLYESTFKIEYLKNAIDLNNILLKNFLDQNSGGFYFTSITSSELFTRQKEIYDGAIPSGNSVAMMNLVRLSKLTGDNTYFEKADLLSKAFSTQVSKYPNGYSQLLSGVDFANGPSLEIVIVGNIENKSTQEMLKEINSFYLPNKVILLKSTNNSDQIEKIADFTKGQMMLNNKTTAYICRNFVCSLPTTDLKKLADRLNIK